MARSPKQKTFIFTIDKLTVRLRDKSKNQHIKTRFYSGLKATVALMFGRSYRQNATTGDHTLCLSMIDTGMQHLTNSSLLQPHCNA